jgi:hypothetical protein
MIGSSSDSCGKWNFSKDALTQMKYTHFLVEQQLRGINLASQVPFGPTSKVAKQLNQKVEVLSNATVAAAANSDKQDLHDAAWEMSSNDHILHMEIKYCLLCPASCQPFGRVSLS